MSGAQIAAEISAALREAAFDAGNGDFTVRLKPAAAGQQTPWDAPETASDPINLAGLDDNIREIYIQGSQATRLARMILVEAIEGVVPRNGDKLEVGGKDHLVLMVMPTAPFGVPVLYEVEIEI